MSTDIGHVQKPGLPEKDWGLELKGYSLDFVKALVDRTWSRQAAASELLSSGVIDGPAYNALLDTLKAQSVDLWIKHLELKFPPSIPPKPEPVAPQRAVAWQPVEEGKQ